MGKAPATSSALVAFVLVVCGSCRDPDENAPDADVEDEIAAVSGTLTMPLEVLGTAGTTTTATITLDELPAGGIKTLYLRTHGVNYQSEASVEINHGPWHALGNANRSVKVLGTAARYGGIGGAFVTLKLDIALTGSEFVVGENTLSFRFNGTDGRSLGFRVLELNLLDAAGHARLPASFFVEDDPTTWKAPRPGAADIAAGRQLWSSATLEESPIKSTHKLLAHCSDCHSQDGRDLKYFNYSNRSIIQRSIFHGLTESQGEQIASFVRSNPSPAPGRVWNPPFQPGVGADTATLADWSAGSGIDAVLDDDSKIAPYLASTAAALRDPATSGMTLKRLDMRTTPIALPLLDWNHWLPLVSPADALGSVAAFEATPAYQTYQTIRTGLSNPSATARAAYLQNQLFYDGLTWYTARGKLEGAITTRNGSGTEAAFVDNYSAAVWSAQKMWELVQEFNLQGVGAQLYGLSGERASWFISNRFIFDVSPHAINNASGAPSLTSYQIFGDPTLGNTCPATPSNPTGSCRILLNDFVASNWYDVQLQLNPGMRRSALGVHQVIDWGYMKNFENIGTISGPADSMRLARFTAKAMDELDTGVSPASFSWGWNYRDEITQLLQIVGDAGRANGWMSNAAYAKILTALYQTWLEKSAAYPVAAWRAVQGTEYDGENLPPASYVLGSGNFPSTGTTGDNLNRSFIDQFVKELPVLQELHQPAALVNAMASFGQLLYPSASNRWTSLRPPVSTQIAAPGRPTVTATGAEQLTVSWPAVAGASSYNVKRLETADQPALTIAFFVTGTAFVDRHALPGKTYIYQVSANANGDAGEGAMSGATSSPVVPHGLISRWLLGRALVAGATVADVATASPVSAGKVFTGATGGSYVSLAQNMSRWLGASATVAAWIQIPHGAVGSSNIAVAPSIFGSTNRTQQAFYYGVLDPQGHVGGAAQGCDGTDAHRPAAFSTQALDDDAWHHVAITRDAATGVVQIYVDGRLSSSRASGTGTCEGISRSIGHTDSQTTGVQWPGLLRDVRVYDEVLSAAQVSAIVAGG